jgi:hypothetical protein
MHMGRPEYDSKNGEPPNIWLYPTADRAPSDNIDGPPVQVLGKEIKAHAQKKYYDRSRCAWIFKGTSTTDFTVPDLKPGVFRLARHTPIGIGKVEAEVGGRLTEISPATAGARFEGSLPILEVLPS